jgi:hypothetical protein
VFIPLVDSLRCIAGHEETWLVASIERSDERDIRRGFLGCPICFAEYPIRDGIAYFGVDPAATSDSCNAGSRRRGGCRTPRCRAGLDRSENGRGTVRPMGSLRADHARLFAGALASRQSHRGHCERRRSVDRSDEQRGAARAGVGGRRRTRFGRRPRCSSRWPARFAREAGLPVLSRFRCRRPRPNWRETNGSGWPSSPKLEGHIAAHLVAPSPLKYRSRPYYPGRSCFEFSLRAAPAFSDGV